MKPPIRRGRDLVTLIRRGTPAACTLIVILLAGCDRVDTARAALCQRIIPALEDGAPTVGAVEIRPDAGDPANTIDLAYRVAGSAEPRHIACRFVGREGGDRLRLAGVTASATGALSPTRLQMLQIWLDLPDTPPGIDAAHTPPGIDAAHTPPLSARGYLVQQLLNGLVLGAIYGLIAVGYAQVFSLLEIVNFAFGELFMMGAYFALVGFVLLAAVGLDHGVVGVAIALAAAIALSLPWGWAIERTVYRPLGMARASNAARLIPLVSAIGLSIFLQNLVRVAQGNRNKWLPPLFEERLRVPLGDGTRLDVGVLQLAIIAAAAALCVALWLVLARSTFGRQQRACAQDRVAAALLGVDVARMQSRTFMLGAALAGIAGFVALLYYGEADPAMGYNVGFKALSAAVVGGIGSLVGSMIGGVLIGIAEALWSGYFDGAYRDVAIFAALIAVLIVRPAGLFGDPGKTSS